MKTILDCGRLILDGCDRIIAKLDNWSKRLTIKKVVMETHEQQEPVEDLEADASSPTSKESMTSQEISLRKEVQMLQHLAETHRYDGEISPAIGGVKRLQSDYIDLNIANFDFTCDTLEGLEDRILAFEPIYQACFTSRPMCGQYLWFKEPPDYGCCFQNLLWHDPLMSYKYILWFVEPPDSPRKDL